jgi:ribonuclease HI
VTDSIVRVRATAVADPRRPGGAWVAELVLGTHRRVESGHEPAARLERLQLLGVVAALECLTRPTPVQVQMTGLYVWRGVTAANRPPDDNDDLWDRLATADRTHTLTWQWSQDPFADLDETATHTLRNAALTLPSIGSVAAEFLAELRTRVSARTLLRYENVLDTLGASTGWAEERDLMQVPATELIDKLHNFFYVLTYKQITTITDLVDARTALPALLTWFADHGHLDAETVTTQIEHVRDELDRDIARRRFVTALQGYVDGTEPSSEDEQTGYSLSNGHARITAVTADTITFRDDDVENWDFTADGKGIPFVPVPIGPITIPPHVAALARTGWRILLTAVKVEDGWRLIEVDDDGG